MEQTGQQTLDSPRHRGLGDLVRALFEEAWRLRRRRRLLYAGVAFSIAVVGAVVFARMQGPASTNGSPLALGGSSAPAVRVATGPGFNYHGAFHLHGKRGFLAIGIEFPKGVRPSWDVIEVGGDFPGSLSGQYALLAGGHGKHVAAGGHKSAWYARLVGSVIPADRGPKQRVVIKLKGRPKGTFTLVPREPGVLKPDSGTQFSDWGR